MRFQDAVANSNDVRDCYRAGLQALLERDRNRLSFKDTSENQRQPYIWMLR